MILEVDHPRLRKIVRICVESRIPLFIWGPPGIGKSTAVRDAAKEIARRRNLEYSEDPRDWSGDPRKFVLIDLRLSQLEPVDLRGLPKPDGDVLRWLPPNFLPRSGQGIIFLDELNLAPPSVQSAAMQLVLDRRLGDYLLPDGWTIVAAGNEPEHSRAAVPLPQPLANRFVHVKLRVPNRDEWIAWARKNEIDERIIRFIENFPDNLFMLDDDSPVFPTPRSWEFASRLLEHADGEDPELVAMLVSAAVGAEIGSLFMEFCRGNLRIPSVEEILANPSEAPIPANKKLRWRICKNLVDYAREKPSLEVIDAIARYCRRLESELGAFVVNEILKIDPEFLIKSEELSKLARKVRGEPEDYSDLLDIRYCTE